MEVQVSTNVFFFYCSLDCLLESVPALFGGLSKPDHVGYVQNRLDDCGVESVEQTFPQKEAGLLAEKHVFGLVIQDSVPVFCKLPPWLALSV